MLDHGIRRTTWLAWSLWVAAVIVTVLTVPLELANGAQGAAQLLVLAFGVAFSTAGALIASRQRANAVGWLFLAMSLLLALVYLARSYAIYGLLTRPGSLPGAVFMAWLEQWPLWFVFPSGIALILLLFPTGRPSSRRWWPIVWLTIGCALLMVSGSMFHPGQLGDALHPPSGPSIKFGVENPVGIGPLRGLLFWIDVVGRQGAFLLALVAAAGFVVRFVHSDGEQRQQLKWVAYAGALIVLGIVGGVIFLGPFPTLQNAAFLVLVVGGLFVGLPGAAAIAILKYRLYDIDLVINKSLVYGALAAFITIVYVAIVVELGALVGTGGKPNLPLSILATAVVAVAFEPIRERLQRFVNRLLFGQRATPYETMARFAEQISGVLSADEVLPRIAEAAAMGVGASRSRVRLFLPDGNQSVATWPAQLPIGEMDLVLPVSYRGEQLGDIAIGKPSGAPLLLAERKLLTDLATQAGLVLHNVRLTRELKQRLDEISAQADAIRLSRQRIVAAQDTERQRLEQTIRQGTEIQLAGIKAGLQQAEQRLINDPVSAAALLEQLTARANETLESLRDVARGIYPPLLRERGLAAALQAQAEKMHVPAAIHANGLDRYPSEAEGAVYFACVEALRSATGTTAIDIAATDSSLEFRVKALSLDLDGRLQDIEDRIEALGGSVVFDNAELSGRITVGVPERVA